MHPHPTEETDMSQNREIVSFNENVPELSRLLELDGAELDRVVGGYTELEAEPSCPNLTSCTTYGDCNSKTSCALRAG